MKCLNEETLQSYLDLECDSKESSAIERHLDQCTRCRALINEVRIDIEELKDNISLLAPKQTPPPRNIINRSLVRRMWPLVSVSAASVVIILLMTWKSNTENIRAFEVENTIYEYLSEQDPNQLWKENHNLILIEEKNGKMQISQ